jgi:hypothetical protein
VRGQPLKPLVKTKRRALLLRRTPLVVSGALVETLFRDADVLSEGGLRVGVAGRDTYYGSTMLAIAFERLIDDETARSSVVSRNELVHAIEGSVRVRLRAMRLARAEAARRVKRGVLGTALCDLRFRDDGSQLRIDVDLEVEVCVSSRASRS